VIVDVRCQRVTVPLRTPFVTALRRATAVESVVVQLVDSDGCFGFGEAPQVWQVTGESLASAEACVLAPLAAVVQDHDPDDLVPLLHEIEGAVVANHGAKAAMDVALHDLVARRRGVSLPVLLGATTHRVETDVTLSAGAADELAAVARQRVDDGFGTLKLKIGADAVGDVARVRAVREAIGPRVALRLDANQAWTARQAVTVITAMEDAGLGLELVEQPVPAADLDAMAWVTSRVDTPIMADEGVFGVRNLVEVIHRRAADIVNVKLAKSGGLRAAATMLEVARAHGIGTIVGSMMEGPIGVGAAASLAAAYGTSSVSDLDAALWAYASPVTGGLRYDADTVVLPNAPGLGIDSIRHP
jgi:L-alanine-DL-glutamate epimerase-like enolase superfamily enzyme